MALISKGPGRVDVPIPVATFNRYFVLIATTDLPTVSVGSLLSPVPDVQVNGFIACKPSVSQGFASPDQQRRGNAHYVLKLFTNVQLAQVGPPSLSWTVCEVWAPSERFKLSELTDPLLATAWSTTTSDGAWVGPVAGIPINGPPDLAGAGAGSHQTLKAATPIIIGTGPTLTPSNFERAWVVMSEISDEQIVPMALPFAPQPLVAGDVTVEGLSSAMSGDIKVGPHAPGVLESAGSGIRAMIETAIAKGLLAFKLPG